jgi:ketosteroid isomerase-like protein
MKGQGTTKRGVKDMPEANVQAVQQLYDAFRRGDIKAVLDGFAEDVEWVIPGPSIIPHAGPRHGREQVAQFFRELEQAEEIQEFEPQEYIAQSDKVVVLGHYRARIKSTGRTTESDWAHVLTLTQAKVTRFRVYTDTAAAEAAYRQA